MTFFAGFAGAAAFLMTFFVGMAVGWRLHRDYTEPPPPEAPSETERRRLEAEQEAFRAMQKYSAADAYGERV